MARYPNDYIPKLRLHKRSGAAVVTLNYHEHQLGKFGTPEAQAKYHSLIARWLTGGRKLLDPIGSSSVEVSPFTVTRLCDDFEVRAWQYYRHPDRWSADDRNPLNPLRTPTLTGIGRDDPCKGVQPAEAEAEAEASPRKDDRTRVGAYLVDDGCRIVLLLLGRKSLAFVEDKLVLSCSSLPLLRLWNRSDELGASAGFDQLLGRLAVLIQLPVSLQACIWAVQDRVIEERIVGFNGLVAYLPSNRSADVTTLARRAR